MQIELDREGEIPLGVQLAWALRSRILAGQLAAGERLPGVRELAASTGVNVNTVRSVYARLEADGLAHSEHGRGTFVAETPRVDDRLARIARRAVDEATTAGLDPREVAAAVYARLGAAAATPGAAAALDPAARRRALRAEIGALERALADERLARALRDHPGRPARSPGGRLLDEDELRAQRDRLSAQLAAIRAPAPADRAGTATPARTRTATRPNVVLRPRLGT